MSNWIIIDRLADIILRHVRGCIVEIGMGVSTPILSKHANQAGVVLYSCDIDPKKAAMKYDHHVVFCGSSFDFMDQFKGEPAIVFLDGCHEYEVVSKEARFFLPALLPNGVLFLHDSLPPNNRYTANDRCGTVYQLRHELEKDPRYNCFTWPYTATNCGLTMVMKRPFCFIDHDSNTDNKLQQP